ncbi:MAG: hypothetical protein R3A79_12315 [Nannocystaceae bacterium]
MSSARTLSPWFVAVFAIAAVRCADPDASREPPGASSSPAVAEAPTSRQTRVEAERSEPPTSVDAPTPAPPSQVAPPAPTPPAPDHPERGPEELLTPQRAVEFALSGPLRFNERFEGREVGLYDQICLFHNDAVVVRVDYCSNTGGSERRGREVAAVEVFARDGQHVRIYAEVAPPGPVAKAKRGDYVMWNVEYTDLYQLPPLAAQAGSAELLALKKGKDALRWRSYPLCYHDEGAFPCIAVAATTEGVLAKHGQAFAENPPASWFTLLGEVDALIAKHGEKR